MVSKRESTCRAESDHHAAPSSYIHMFPDIFPDQIYLDKADSVSQKAQVIKISGRLAASW